MLFARRTPGRSSYSSSQPWLLVSLLPLAAMAAETPGRLDEVSVNRRGLAQQHPVSPPPYDSHPVFVDGPGGLAAWHSFVPGAERIVGRQLDARGDVPLLDLSPGRGVVSPPELVRSATGAVALLWSELHDGRWRVVARLMSDGRWTVPLPLSPPNRDALHPMIEAIEGDRFAAAWMQWNGRNLELVSTEWSGGAGGPPIAFSDPRTDAFRPQLVAGEGGVLDAVWDAYQDGTSRVYARRLRPALGPIEPVSSSPERCLKPVATRNADGELLVAWIRAADVMAAAGAVDQMHAIQMARRTNDGWRVLTDADGGDALAWLAHGLLAQIEPKPSATGGYLGRRRDPMFVRDGDATWLLWERKASHVGSTTVATGELLGRRIAGTEVGPTVLLASGSVDYRVAHHARAVNGQFAVISSALPRDGQRTYSLSRVDLGGARPVATEPWRGWQPVTWPLPGAEPRRHTLREGEREYRLFWMDSHVHSGLSADAEGEPDEILFYARDRGRLDAVVMQENDFYNCPLTDYEYQLGAFYGRVLSSPRFVALPGYEWTQRVPADRAEPLDQPRFWGRTYPNHRTIIYPRSGGPLIRYVDVNNDIRRLYDVVARHGGVMHTQHAEFDFTGAPGEAAIEVTAGWGLYFLNPGKIHATLNRGFRAGFVGTSDSHRRNPGLGGGLTGIYAAELTPEAILDAYRARRVFATNGARIAIEARANGELMGRDVTARGDARLTLFVSAPRPIRRATLIRDGTDVKVFTAAGDATSATFEYEENGKSAGTHWYYWRVEQEGVSRHYGGNVSTAFGNLAWSTPHWITFGM